MDFADIFQSMKTGKKCKNVDIPGSIGLPQDGLPARLHFFVHLPGKTILRSSNFGDDGWRVGS